MDFKATREEHGAAPPGTPERRPRDVLSQKNQQAPISSGESENCSIEDTGLDQETLR